MVERKFNGFEYRYSGKGGYKAILRGIHEAGFDVAGRGPESGGYVKAVNADGNYLFIFHPKHHRWRVAPRGEDALEALVEVLGTKRRKAA